MSLVPYVASCFRQEAAKLLEVARQMDVKDSGKREQFSSGMQRDTQEGKVRFDLAFDGPLFERYAVHLTKGAVKYQPRNWMKASSQEELERFRESALRHFMAWWRGERDEDHAAAVWFNLNGAEYVREKLLPMEVK